MVQSTKMKRASFFRLSRMLISIGFSLAVMVAFSPVKFAHAASYVPAQFIAKQYTEALGRAPDQGGWQAQVNYFQSNGCSADTLASLGRDIFTSSEFNNLGYDNPAKLLTLYRGALNRELDADGFNANLTRLDNGTSWSDVVNALFTSSEFTSLASTICGGGVDGSSSSYYWGTQPPMAIPTSGDGFSGTEDQLQSALDNTPSGGTVYLTQKTLVLLSSALTIPAGVTLSTTGQPDNPHYALMGRLSRIPGNTPFGGPAVLLKDGAKLLNVWVDGQRDQPGNDNSGNNPSQNIRLLGGTGTTVSNSRSTNTAGPSSLETYGSLDGDPCGSNTITNNLITAYSSDNYIANKWTDGISDHCENSDVENNQIVDATDAAIVTFEASTVAQKSKVANNTILSAGNSIYWGIDADPLTTTYGHNNLSFSGSSFDHNTLWTGPNTHFDIAVAAGTREIFGDNANTGTGASFTSNTTGSLSARVTTGIAVAGMLDVNIADNSFQFVRVAANSCPDADVAAEVAAGHASGTIPSPYTDTLFDNCNHY